MEAYQFDFNGEQKANDSIEEIKEETKELVDEYIDANDLDELIAYSFKKGYDEAVSEFKKFLEEMGMAVIDE